MNNMTPYFTLRRHTTQFLVIVLACFASVAHAAHREIQMVEGVVFGLDPAWSSGSEFDKAFDGDVNTFYDYAYGNNESYVGFDHGDVAVPVEIRFTARKKYSERMVGGRFEGSNESATAGYETLYEVKADPGESGQSISLSTGTAYRYYRYLAPAGSYGNIAEFSIVAEEATVLETVPPAPEGFRSMQMNGQTVFGLDPAWRTGREFEKAFDGDSGTYYDYKYGDRESFVGFDSGQATSPLRIHFTPRDKRENRMIGGRFEGSNESPYSGYVTLYEITSEPDPAAQAVELNTTETFRYYRYLASAGSYGNIAEFSIDWVLPDMIDQPVATEEPTTQEEFPVVEEPSEPESIVYPEGYREAVVADTLVFGLDPAWRSGREFENVFDGDGSTYYDYKYGDRESFVGFDASEAILPERIIFQARAQYTGRMIGGRFEASNESPVSGYTILHTVSDAPSEGEQSVDLVSETAYRYFRYVAPSGSYGNIAKFAVVGSAPLVDDSGGAIDGSGSSVGGESGGASVAAETIPGQAGIRFSVNLEQAGLVSAAVYDSGGRIVRTLLEAEPLKAGTHALLWDGLDREGRAAPVGEYTFKVLRGDGLQSEFVTNLGLNPGSGIFDTWVGNHDGAASVAVDATGMYIAAQITETAPVLLKQSLDGSVRHWTETRADVTNGRFQGGSALASDQNGTLYMLQQDGRLQAINTSDGQLRASWNLLPEGIVYDMFTYQHSLEQIAGADVAAYGDTVVVTLRASGKALWIDPSSGAIIREMALVEPLGVAVASNGEALVISGGGVIGIQPNGVTRNVITQNLHAPQRISIDRSNGSILVTDGFPETQVKRFSATGAWLATYGRSGGRASGAYDANDLYAATDITADGQGGFFIAEPQSPPRRVAHFNSSGLVQNEWFGGQPYYAWAEPDPQDPTKAWYFTIEGLVLAQIDLTSGAWAVLETYMPDQLAQGLIRQPHGHVGQWRVLYKGGQRYLISDSAAQVLVHNDGQLRAVSVSSDEPEQLAQAMDLAGYTSSAKAFRWLDANGDGEPQPVEFTFTGHQADPSVNTVHGDFSLIGFDRSSEVFTVVKTEALWGPYGPYYPVGNESGLNLPVAATVASSRPGSRGSGSYMDAEGNYYAHYNVESERHGTYWPTDWASVSRFVKMDAGGNELWNVGRHAVHGGLAGSANTSYIETPEGQLHVPVKVIGEVDDTLVLADRVENPALAWTKDGLYIGSLLQNRAKDGLPDSVYSWFLTETGDDAITTSDNGSGGRVVQYADGSVLWFAQGRNSIPVYKVTGWGEWDRLESSFSLKEVTATAASQGSGLTAQYYDGEISATPAASVLNTQVWHGLGYGDADRDNVIDGPWGPVYDWSNGPAEISRDTNFAVRWTGEVEAPLSETYIFSTYARGGVRLWIDGQQIIFSWNEVIERVESTPVALTAGQRYSIQLDYHSSQAHPAISLNWESHSLDRARIPSQYLYPERTAPVYVQTREATDYTEAASFDVDYGGMIDWMTDAYAVTGYRQWSFGYSGAYIGYTSVEFGDGISTLQVHGSGYPSDGGDAYPVTLAFRLGSPSGSTIANVTLPKDVQTVEVPVAAVTGRQDVYVVNTTTNQWHHIDFRWFRFQ